MGTINSNIGIMMDGMGLVLSFILIYVRYYFRDTVEKSELHALPFVLLSLCLCEGLNYPAKAYAPAVVFQILEYAEGILECILVGFTMQIMIENVSFYEKLKKKLTKKNTRIFCIAVVAVSLLVQTVWNLARTGSAGGYNKIFIARWVLLGVMLYMLCVFFVQSLIAKDWVNLKLLLPLFLCTVLSVTVAEAELLLLGREFTGDGMGYAMGYTLLYTIANIQMMIQSKEKEAMLRADVTMAKNIQQDALPREVPAFPHHKDVTVNALMATAKDVGGDFYDYFEIDGSHACFLIADVSGKGMPASLFMMTAKTTIKTIALENAGTAEIIRRANRFLSANNASMMFVTVWIGILNTETLELEYTNAAHNPPVLLHPDGSRELLDKVHGTVLGMKNNNFYSYGSKKLHTGDRLFLYTDGVPEAHDVSDAQFGEDRMIEILTANAQMAGDVLLQKLKLEVDGFARGRDPFDDITMMMIDMNIAEEAEDAFDSMDFLDAL